MNRSQNFAVKMKLTTVLIFLLVCGYGTSAVLGPLDPLLKVLLSLTKNLTFGTFNFFTGGCAECIMLADFIILLRHIGTTKEMYTLLFQGLCGATILVPSVDHDVCIGLVEMNLDTILYLIDQHFTLDGLEFCSVVMQNADCKPRPADWSVNIAPGQSGPNNQTGSNGHGHCKHRKHTGTTEATTNENPIIVAHITDIHYDPLYAANSNNKCDRPLCCEKLDNKTVPKDSMAGFWADYSDCDIPSYFVENAFKNIQAKNKPSYVYFTGDIIAHDSWARTKQRNIDDVNFITNMMVRNFPGAEIFPILGNHDTHPINLFSPHKLDNTSMSTSWVFESAYEAWKGFLPESTKDTILKGGYYTTTTKDGLRIIALNNNVGYCMNFWLLDDPVDPYGQLQWFADTMLAAELNKEKVHVLIHVPNGDSYMNIPYAKNFRNIVTRFRNTITGIFCGHTHLDELEIIYDGADPTNVIWNGGSLTPFSNFNPNYRIYQVDRSSFDILDFSEYFVELDKANLNTASLDWKLLYSFKQQYGVPDMSAESISNLAYRMAASKALRTTYFKNSVRYAPPSLQAGCDNSCDKANLCKMTTGVYGDYTTCNNVTNNMS